MSSSPVSKFHSKNGNTSITSLVTSNVDFGNNLPSTKFSVSHVYWSTKGIQSSSLEQLLTKMALGARILGGSFPTLSMKSDRSRQSLFRSRFFCHLSQLNQYFTLDYDYLFQSRLPVVNMTRAYVEWKARMIHVIESVTGKPPFIDSYI